MATNPPYISIPQEISSIMGGINRTDQRNSATWFTGPLSTTHSDLDKFSQNNPVSQVNTDTSEYFFPLAPSSQFNECPEYCFLSRKNSTRRTDGLIVDSSTSMNCLLAFREIAGLAAGTGCGWIVIAVSYTHLRAHET